MVRMLAQPWESQYSMAKATPRMPSIGVAAAELVGIVGDGSVFAQTRRRRERNLAAPFKPTRLPRP